MRIPDFDLRPRPFEPQTRATCLRCGRTLMPTALGWVHTDLPFDEVHPAVPGEPRLYDYTEPELTVRRPRFVLEPRPSSD